MALIPWKGAVLRDFPLPNRTNLVFVGLGWEGAAALDISLMLLDCNGMPRSPDDLYCYVHEFDGHIRGQNEEDENLRKESPVAVCTIDRYGDDQVILIDYDKIPSDVAKMAIFVSIYHEFESANMFGEVAKVYVRLCSCDDESSWLQGIEKSVELRRDLTEDAPNSDAVLAFEIVRNGNAWDYIAIGESIGDGSDKNGIIAIAKKYGLI